MSCLEFVNIYKIVFLYIKKPYTEIRKLCDEKGNNAELKSDKETSSDHGGEEQKVI